MQICSTQGTYELYTHRPQKKNNDEERSKVRC